MSNEVLTLNAVEKVSYIVDILESKTHSGFPIVGSKSSEESKTYGRCLGLILRSQLVILLQYKVK